MPIDGLRSPYEKVGGLPVFGRTLDKIRIFEKGELPRPYHRFLGSAIPQSMDAGVCRFLGIEYDTLRRRVLDGGTDEEILGWAYGETRTPSEEEVQIFHDVMTKRGWRDETSDFLRKRVIEHGFSPEVVVTWPDLIDADEGRPPKFPPDPPQPPGPIKATALIPGLRSPYEEMRGVVHVKRMLDKIRLIEADALPPEWSAQRGAPKGFDGLTCGFLGVNYHEMEAKVKDGASDEEMEEWIFSTGANPSPFAIAMGNAYLAKRCWRDGFAPRLQTRLQEAGMPAGAALVMFILSIWTRAGRCGLAGRARATGCHLTLIVRSKGES